MATRYISYIRVSTQKQGRSGLGLEAQQAAIGGYLQSNGGKLVGEYQEVESGRHNDRVQLAEALRQCRLLGAVLLIAKLDRLSRNAVFLLQLQDSGVDFVCCDMPGANRMTIGVMALVADQEARFISDRTKAALQAAKARGVHLGNPMGAAAFGNRRGSAQGAEAVKVQADARAEQLADVVRGMREAGMSFAKMADRLNADGYLTARGGKWHPATVRNLLARIDRMVA